jgi:hypothetical protein
MQQLLQVDGRIQIAVDHLAAVLTGRHPPGQADRFLVPRLPTAFGGREKPACQQHFTAVPLALAGQLSPELDQGHVRNRLRVGMVLHHPTPIQVLQHNR